MVYCDKCGGRFKLKPKLKKVKDDIERIHFKCKHCKHDYTAYYVNDYIKQKQKELRQTDFKNIKKRMELENEIQKEMDKLRKTFEK